MKRTFINPEINSVDLTLTDVILASGNMLVNPNAVTYGLKDEKELEEGTAKVWTGGDAWF